MAFCGNCGTQLNDGVQFCPTCGKRISPRAPQQAQPIMRDVAAPSAPGETVIGSWEAPEPAAQPTANAPVSAQGPSTRYSSSGGGAAPAASRKKSCLPRLIGAVAALAVIAVLALYVVPLFIPHPVDPHEHESYMPPASHAASNAAASASAGAAESQAGSASASAGEATTSAEPGAAGQPAAQTTRPEGYSTYETPSLQDFIWLTGEAAAGYIPAGATRILDVGTVTGGWKAYLFGDGMDRLLNANIEIGQSSVSIMLDWFYVHDSARDEGFDDNTPNSVFAGPFDGGMLDATGPGRITLVAFWEQDGRQFATGSFIWPDGTAGTIALVRP